MNTPTDDESAGRPRLAAIVLLEFLPARLARSRDEREQTVNLLAPIRARYPDVHLRWFDADALGHGYSDFVVCEFEELERYHFLWEEIRDTEFFSAPLVRIKDVILGIEEGFRRYEQTSRSPA